MASVVEQWLKMRTTSKYDPRTSYITGIVIIFTLNAIKYFIQKLLGKKNLYSTSIKVKLLKCYFLNLFQCTFS